MHRRSKARISTNNNRRMSGTTATTSNHKSNQRKIHDDKFAIQKKCISIDMKVDEIDMSAYDANTLDDLNKHRSQLDEQNHLYKELVQTIFTQKNVEKPLIAIVQQLGEKIKQYDDKISKKFQSLKQNGIPIDSKQSSSSPSKSLLITSLFKSSKKSVVPSVGSNSNSQRDKQIRMDISTKRLMREIGDLMRRRQNQQLTANFTTELVNDSLYEWYIKIYEFDKESQVSCLFL